MVADKRIPLDRPWLGSGGATELLRGLGRIGPSWLSSVGLSSLLAAAAILLGAAATIYGTALLVAAVAIAAFASPRVGRLGLATLIVIIPWLNPALAGVGTGRFYLSHVLILIAALSATGILLLRRFRMRYAVLLTTMAAFAVAVGLTRVGADADTLGWVYRPLQPFLVTASAALLLEGQSAERWLRYAVIGGVIGCGLAVTHSLIPVIDPFAITRPDDIPFVSAIGEFERASGGFVYPNNLGTFAMYAALLALSALILDRPRLPRTASIVLLTVAVGALLLSASRTAAAGLLLASVFLLARANVGRRLTLAAVVLLFGSGVLMLASASGQVRDVFTERIATAGGQSLVSREAGWSYALERFRESPLLGTGIEQSRLDSSWLLYLYTGGLIGIVLIAVLVVYLWGPTARRGAPYPQLAKALIGAILVTAVLQDTLGQTLSSWYPAVLLGLCLAQLRGYRSDVVASLSPRGSSSVWTSEKADR